MTWLVSLNPLQRFLRIRRLLREVRGQRALLRDQRQEVRIHRAAEQRLARAMTDLIDEMNQLDEAGVLNAVAECFVAIFGGTLPANQTGTKAP